MKTIKWVAVTMLILLPFVLAAVALWPVLYSAATGNSVAANWRIYLAGSREELYCARSVKNNIFGDEPRYTLYEYADFTGLENAVPWRDGEDEKLELEAAEIISRLEIDPAFLPDWEAPYKAYYQLDDSGAATTTFSRIYLFYTLEDNELFVIENLGQSKRGIPGDVTDYGYTP